LILAEHSYLANVFNIVISGLSDKSLMEIEANVNPGTEKRWFGVQNPACPC
jgi:hypothetical protein